MPFPSALQLEPTNPAIICFVVRGRVAPFFTCPITDPVNRTTVSMAVARKAKLTSDNFFMTVTTP